MESTAPGREALEKVHETETETDGDRDLLVPCGAARVSLVTLQRVVKFQAFSVHDAFPHGQY